MNALATVTLSGFCGLHGAFLRSLAARRDVLSRQIVTATLTTDAAPTTALVESRPPNGRTSSPFMRNRRRASRPSRCSCRYTITA